jgi:hypothetical protein
MTTIDSESKSTIIGENTLEAQLTRLATRSITEKGGFDQSDYLEKYVKFMTTPGSHNDTCKEHISFIECLF